MKRALYKYPLGTIVCIKTGGHYRNFIKINEKTKNGNKNFMSYPTFLIKKYLNINLKKWEVIHHINGNKIDDRLKNLKVMTRSEHTSLHQKGKKHLKAKEASIKYFRNRRNKFAPIVKRLANEYYSIKKIEKFLSIDRNTITRIIKENNIELKNPTLKYLELIKKYKNKGYSNSDIKKIVPLSLPTILKIQKIGGI